MSRGGEQQLTKLGRYELVTRIGHGGMAEVQLALQRGPAGFEKLVVIKLVHANLAKEKTFVDMLLDEARVAALVKHPNVVDIYDLGEADGRYFIAMEYLEGEPLLSLLRAGRDGRRLDPLSTARLIADTAEGLEAAHELQSIGGDPMELVHHDVSLGNIMVLYNGQVKLVDFGVAKASQNAGPQMKVHGKFGYMAPEKLKGRGSDRRGDIWSLGVVLWESLTLRRLFRGANEQDTMRMVLDNVISKPSSMGKDLPPALDPIVMKALERDPDKRYQRAKDLAVDIEEVLRQQAYGGRNDQISKYMQATFASHITARKKLLHEVIAKGKASDDVLKQAFDESQVTELPNKRGVHASGEFAIAFGAKTPPPVRQGAPTQQTFDDETSSVLERRRESQEMMAEGTPHSVVTSLPKRITKQMFAEATPVHDVETYDRGVYAPTRSSTDVSHEGEAVNALVASLQPAPYVEEADAAVLAMVASLASPSASQASEASAGKAQRPEGSLRDLHEQAMKMDVVSSVLKGWDHSAPAATPTPPMVEEPKRKPVATTGPRVTSRKLEVIKPPVARPTEPQMIAVVVEQKPLMKMLLVIALIVVVLFGAGYFVTTLL